jgi:hypothetical protein
MKKIRYSILVVAILCFFNASAQSTFENRKKLVNFNFGISMPMGVFNATDSSGLFGGNGFDMDISYIKITRLANLGIGFNFGYTVCNFKNDDFKYNYKAQEVNKLSNYNFVKMGMNFYYPFTLVNVNSKSLNLFVKVTGGLQFNIPPAFTLKYLPTQNIYTDIKYSPETTLSFYSEFSGGFLILFNERIGFNVSGSYFLSPRHSMKHHVFANTSFENNEGAIEERTRVFEYTNYLGIKAGLTILW